MHDPFCVFENLGLLESFRMHDLEGFKRLNLEGEKKFPNNPYDPRD